MVQKCYTEIVDKPASQKVATYYLRQILRNPLIRDAERRGGFLRKVFKNHSLRLRQEGVDKGEMRKVVTGSQRLSLYEAMGRVSGRLRTWFGKLRNAFHPRGVTG